MPSRTPGWREVLAIAVVVVAAVFALEVLGVVVPPLGEAFGRLPLTIVALVVGTVAVLLALVRRRPPA